MSHQQPPVAQPLAPRSGRRRGFLLLGLASCALAACAATPGREPLRVSLAGIEPMAGEGLELRFKLRLRLINPGEGQVNFDGAFVELDLQGRPFASGAAQLKGSVPRFGEQVLELPVTVPALGALRQILGIASGGAAPEKISYGLRGRLGGVGLGGQRFEQQGELRLSELLR